MATEKEFYTVKDIMQKMGIGKNKAYKLFRAKAFPAIKCGNSYIIHKDQFERWIKINSGACFIL